MTPKQRFVEAMRFIHTALVLAKVYDRDSKVRQAAEAFADAWCKDNLHIGDGTVGTPATREHVVACRASILKEIFGE